jgi:hypothetical protein
LESYGYKTFIDDATGEEWEQLDIDEDKVRDALKALQALEWEETDFSHIDRAALMKELLPGIEKMFGVAYKEWEEKK